MVVDRRMGGGVAHVALRGSLRGEVEVSATRKPRVPGPYRRKAACGRLLGKCRGGFSSAVHTWALGKGV